MSKRDIVSNINLFMNVPIDAVGQLHRRRRHLGAGHYVDIARRDGRAVRDLELPADQQSLQRLQPDADPRRDHRPAARLSGQRSARPSTSISSAILLPLVGLVAGGDRVLDAMGDVVAQDLLLDAAQRGAHRGDLRHDVDAVAVLLDHAGEAAHLAFDAAQPLQARRSWFRSACLTIYPQGYRCQASEVPPMAIAMTVTNATRCTSARTAMLHGRGTAASCDPVCGMTVDPHTTPSIATTTTAAPTTSARRGCRTKFAADPAKYLDGRATRRRARAGRHDLHLPDASGDPAGRPRLLPDLRHGARAGDRRPPTPGPIPSSPT